MFAVKDTPQDSTGFTPFELIYGHKVRIPMTLLKRIWMSEDQDPDMKTAYQYVIVLRERELNRLVIWLDKNYRRYKHAIRTTMIRKREKESYA